MEGINQSEALSVHQIETKDSSFPRWDAGKSCGIWDDHLRQYSAGFTTDPLGMVFSVSCRFVEIPIGIISVRSWELMIVAWLDEAGHSLYLFNLLPTIVVSCSTQSLALGVIRLMILLFASGFCSTLKGFVPLATLTLLLCLQEDICLLP